MRPRHRLPRGGSHCDFCSSPDIESLYYCDNFEWEGSAVFKGATGRWAACWLCSKLIDGMQWSRLNSRVMREVLKRADLTPEGARLLRASVKVLHALFAKHMGRETLKIHMPKVRRITLLG